MVIRKPGNECLKILLWNSLRQYPFTVYDSVTYPTLSIRVRSSPLSVLASKFRTKIPNALEGSISIFSFNSSPKPTTEASWPLLVTIRMRTFGVGAVFVTMFVPDGRNGTLHCHAIIRKILALFRGIENKKYSENHLYNFYVQYFLLFNI